MRGASLLSREYPYDYKCDECGCVIEIVQIITEDPQKEIECERCNKTVSAARLVKSGIFTESRWKFLDYLPKNAICAELGCWKGDLSYQILEITNPKRFFMVDPYWKAYGDMFYDKNKRGTLDYFTRATQRTRMSSNYQATTFVIEYDTVFLQDYADNFFDWVYLDTTHTYEDTLVELSLLKSKVKDNGIICGHDYRYSLHPGLTIALHEWLENNKDYELCLIDNYLQWIIKHKR